MFDVSPEDFLPQSFPCDCGGEIMKDEDGIWRCDKCNFAAKDENNKESTAKV
jgi:hypothetical protein